LDAADEAAEEPATLDDPAAEVVLEAAEELATEAAELAELAELATELATELAALLVAEALVEPPAADDEAEVDAGAAEPLDDTTAQMSLVRF